MEWTEGRDLGTRCDSNQIVARYKNLTHAEVVVETGTFRPRYRMLPLMLPVLSRVFLEYASSLLFCF